MNERVHSNSVFGWTKEIPATPGYYWLRERGSEKAPQVVQIDDSSRVYAVGGSLLCFLSRASWMSEDDWKISEKRISKSLWAGPLEPPLVEHL